RRRPSGHRAGPARHERARSGPQAGEARHERAHFRRRHRRLAGSRARPADRNRRDLPPDARTTAAASRGPRGAPMTWADLHAALGARGLIQAGQPVQAGAAAAAGPVTGVAYDSRAVTPGQVFVALKGQRADGTAFARQAIERGAAAIVSEQPAPPDTR